ncbi:alpha/beta fold hydrolase [Mesorhizobium sp. M9A.F.Ca.ET.002.03.1.2]|uniref:alpha/beta fold hydrolase n=1 Tax=Mesorhizobium sp. M9A.F.Ca.ET.002.03.1.2 TaxID=2493668 RepID=UPI000F75C37F|nr:alpha/beta fold hydrolase [Mesorhizobium sp. M9A.F.Ca.ET.002.03.1.2]AZN98811.1 alpha/beta fold hydrolase [Mesorhizobium sp. M9A.F.Ca.ET.002.03.1.2]
MSLEIHVLGDLTVLRHGEVVALPPSKKTRALLAYLALVERPQRRERLCEMFWEVPDDPRGALRWSLSKIRQIVDAEDGGVLEADRNAVRLNSNKIVLDIAPLRGLDIRDIAAFETARLEGLAGAFRGRVLGDLSLPRCPEFEAWRVAIADELHVTHLRILRVLVDRLADEPARALPYAHVLHGLEPEDEALRADIRRLGEAARQSAMIQSRTSRNETVAAPGPDSMSPSELAAETPLAASPKRALSQEIRRCTTPDGVGLAYALSGQGLPLVRAAHWMSHLELDWDSPVWKHWIEGLSTNYQVMRYDQRGNGLSDRYPADLSFDAMLADLESIIDAAGLRRVFLLGISQGCAVSIAYAVRHPERVAGMVLYGGFAKGWRKRGNQREIARREAMGALMREGWGQDDPVFRQMFTSLFIPEGTPEQRNWYNELQRNTAAPEIAHRIFEEGAVIDVEELLPRIRVPTLVMHATEDAVIPFDHGQAIAGKIPGARFVALESANHVLLAHEPAFATFLDETRRFLADPEQTQQLAGPQASLGINRSRQNITVLAAEVVSPMHVFEAADPEAAIRELQPVEDEVIQVIESHGGVITSAANGTITAAFGLARATEDHAYLACRAALAAKLAVEELSQGGARLRAGIDTGEVIVRQQWTNESSKVELAGAAPRAANWVMRALRRPTIAATARACAAAGGYVQMHRLAQSEHPQLGGDERAYELLGENHALSRWHLRANRGLTGLVARGLELKTLLATWRRVREGHGQVVGIVADPGLGKSRLAHEFLSLDEVAGFTVLESGGSEFDSTVALGVVKKLLLSACGIRSENTLGEAQRRFARRHAELRLDPRHTAPLSFLADLPVDDYWRNLDARERTARVSEAMNAFLVAMSRASPMALLVEDLHWIDVESEAVLNRLVDFIGANRIMLVATHRSSYRHDWAQRGYFQQIRLERFVRDDVEEFLTELLGSESGLEELRNSLVERAEGTPLFLEEMVRALVANGVLAGQPGRYELKKPADSVTIPSTVQSLIAARIQQLGEAEKQILQLASVIGKNVPYPLLWALSPLTETELEACLARLQALEFLFEVQSYPHVEYTFKHALTLTVTYESLLAEDRKRLHRAALVAMERLYAGSLNHHVEELAEHALRAEAWEPAARYLLQAVGRAEERSAYAAAVQFLENALKAVAALPRSVETLAQAIDLRVRMRPAYGALGAYRKALPRLLEARDLAMELGDPQLISDVLLHLSYLNSSHGRYDEALEPAQTLNRNALANGVQRCISESDLAASQALLLRSEARQALERLLPHEENFTGAWRSERFGQLGTRAVWFFGHRAQAEARLGRFERAERSLAELQKVAAEVARPIDSCAAAYFTGVVGVLRGPTPALVAALQACSSEAQTSGSNLLRPWLLTMLGHAEFLLGRVGVAGVTLEKAVTEAKRLDLPQFECHARAVLACIHTRRGEPEAAANISHALELARGRGDPWSEIIVLRALAELKPSKSAIAWLEQACSLARRTELRPELARSLRALGLAQRRGKIAGAEATLAEAGKLYAEMQLREEFSGNVEPAESIPPDRVPTAMAM